VSSYDSRGYEGITQMQAESTLAPVQIGGGTSLPSVFIPSYRRASAFPFPVA
jgi:hypothetical protein